MSLFPPTPFPIKPGCLGGRFTGAQIYEAYARLEILGSRQNPKIPPDALYYLQSTADALYAYRWNSVLVRF